MTFYLKYRPQTLAELDQEEVRVTLEKIVKSKNIPHAFLFSGPKGTGKTSAARILAKVINCEDPGKNGEPCNECDQCISIAKGQNIDTIEIDAASHRGIEDIRMIRDAVKLSPARAKKKVYIIDEAHMLTTEASNALLKTLEEPPDHVVFILATTNPEKLIATVRSRVTNVPFKKATAKEIAAVLSKIAEKEGIKIEREFFEIIAGKSDGSFRDAVKIFEQMVLENVDFEKGAAEYLSGQKTFDVTKLLNLISEKDTKSSLAFIEDAVESGIGAKEIGEEVIGRLRNMLLANYGLSEENKTDLFGNSDLLELLKTFSEAASKIPQALIDQVPLEIAIVEWCEGEKTVNKGNEVKNTKEGEGGKDAGIKNDRHKNSDVNNLAKSDNTGQNSNSSEKSESVEQQLNRLTKRGNDVSNGHTEKIEVQNNVSDSDSQIEINDKIWREILGKVKPGHTSTEALLRAAKPLEFNGSVLKLGVYYKFHKERLEEKQHRDILEEALEIHIGSPVKVVCTLTEPPSIPESSPQKDPDVLLTEPKEDIKPNPVLTQNNNPDIIKLAEEIFSN